ALAWAAARLGAIPSLLSAHLDPEIVEVLLRRIKPRVIVSDAMVAQRMNLTPEHLNHLGSRLIADAPVGIAPSDLLNSQVPSAAPRRSDEPMMITHTSSTTGISKLC